MRRFVDLHTHSTASDGAATSAELVRLADDAQLAALAMTDHDTTAGLDLARQEATRFPQLKLIAGIEISARFPGGTMHILGLGLALDTAPLADLTARMQAARRERNPKILAKLNALGVELTMDEVAAAAGAVPGQERVIGRMHIAQAMVNRGCVKTIEEAFDRYLGDAGPAYVDKERLSPGEAIAAVHAAGGLAVLAHPPQLHCTNRLQLQWLLQELKQGGLDGLEVYHSQHTDVQTRLYLDLAKELDLGLSGGSDFHGPAKPSVTLGHPRVSATFLSDRFRHHLGI